MKTFRTAIAALAVLLAGAGAAAAQSYYAGAYGGANIGHESDVSISSLPGIPFTVTTDTGYAVGGFVGYDFGGSFRVEGELAYRRNGLDEQSALGTSVQMQGDVSSLALMVNGIYDFGSGASAFTPHVGAGIGVARFSLIDAGPVGSPAENDDDTVFAYQLIAGVGYELSPTLTIFADYRLFGTTDPEFTQSSGTVIETEYLNSTMLIGISTSF
jgi:opacity protein-like surface antigen